MFDPPVALASLSGRSDTSWAAYATPYVGAAFLGGIALDAPTRDAARAMVARDRTEFLPPDPHAFIDSQLRACAGLPIQPGFNVRAVSLDAVAEAARICAGHDAIIEINAHCRQPEMCAAGAGETLLRDPDRLTDQVATAAATGATVSVKVRTEVAGVDLPTIAGQVSDAGAAMVHVDAMDSESVVADVVDAIDRPVIANNGVRDRATVDTYLEYGAAAVSVGRPSDDREVLSRVADAVTATRVRPNNESF
ncbi:MAG: tRNA-dihydrouridine synthase [Halobacteriaceae archaeon]